MKLKCPNCKFVREFDDDYAEAIKIKSAMCHCGFQMEKYETHFGRDYKKEKKK